MTTSLPFILPLVVFPEGLFSALYSSSCTLPLSVLWSPPFPSTTTFMQMILSSSSLSTQTTLTQAFLIFKTLFNKSLSVWLLIFLLLTPLRLNSYSSDSKTNMPKYTMPHLIPPTLLEILASCLTNILTSLTKLHLTSKPVTITLIHFAVSGLTWIPQLLPLLLTPNLITVILSTINPLSLNYPVSSISRTLLLVVSLKLPSPVISLPSYALSTGSESLNASNTSSSHLPTKFLQLLSLHTFITLSLFNVLILFDLHPTLLLLGHRHHPL